MQSWSKAFPSKYDGRCVISGISFAQGTKIRLVQMRGWAKARPVLERVISELGFSSGFTGGIAGTSWHPLDEIEEALAALDLGRVIQVKDTDHRHLEIRFVQGRGWVVKRAGVVDGVLGRQDVSTLLEGCYAWISWMPRKVGQRGGKNG